MPEQASYELLASIRARLQPICANMPTHEFDEMTARMAEIEWRYTHQSTLALGDKAKKTTPD